MFKRRRHQPHEGKPKRLFDALAHHGARHCHGPAASSATADSKTNSLPPVFGRCLKRNYRLIMGRPLRTQCGFRLVAGSPTPFQWQRSQRWGFDHELLFIELKSGLQNSRGRVKRYRSPWGHDERSRLSYLKGRNQDVGRSPTYGGKHSLVAYARNVVEFTPEGRRSKVES